MNFSEFKRPLSGWIKDERDERDLLHIPKVRIADSADLSKILPAVRDQGNIGSCTGFGIGANITGTAKAQGRYVSWFSPTWIYNGGRLEGGTLNYDSGSMPRNNLEFCRKHGFLLEPFRPYRDILDRTNPLTWEYKKESVLPRALSWTIDEYVRITNGIAYIKSALAEGHLVSIGAPWFDSWSKIGSNGKASEDYSTVIGGHEFLCWGFNNSDKTLFCMNRWGTRFGKKGMFTIKYSAVDAWLANGGYDAHYLNFWWGQT